MPMKDCFWNLNLEQCSKSPRWKFISEYQNVLVGSFEIFWEFSHCFMERQSRTCHMTSWKVQYFQPRLTTKHSFTQLGQRAQCSSLSFPLQEQTTATTKLIGKNCVSIFAHKRKMMNYDQNAITRITKKWPLKAFPFRPLRSQHVKQRLRPSVTFIMYWRWIIRNQSHDLIQPKFHIEKGT